MLVPLDQEKYELGGKDVHSTADRLLYSLSPFVASLLQDLTSNVLSFS